MMRRESFQQMVLRKLSQSTTEDGDFIYPGSEDVAERTGSNLNHLVAYAMHDMKENPIDYDVFREFLIKTMKIPDQLLYNAKQV